MNETFTQVMTTYKAQLADCPETADRSLLDQARELFHAEISDGPITSELAHLGLELYFCLDDRPGIVRLMTDYLRQDLSVEEEAWARWWQVDYMAALAYPNGEKDPEPCRQVVATHQDFLSWAKTHLPIDRWLWVMHDGTQAVCWRLAGCGDDWNQIFEAIYPAVKPSPENRHIRFVYLRTASTSYRIMGNFEKALTLAQEVHDLSLEDAAWEYTLKMVIEACVLKIHTYYDWGLKEKSQAICQEFVEYLEQLDLRTTERDTTHLMQLAGAFENMGSALFFTRQYEQSVPLLERAAMISASLKQEMSIPGDWGYMRLAAAVWKSTQDRQLTFAWLRKGAAVCTGDGLKLFAYPEFAEVVDDPEFIAASRAYRSK